MAQQTPPRAMPARLGPRPLLHHMMLATGSWLGSAAALPLWRSGSLAWSPDLQGPAARLRHDLAGSDPDAFAAAVEAEARHRLSRFLTGIEAYRRHPYRRLLADPPTAWRAGTTRLLDYGGPGAGNSASDRPCDGLPLLVIPSLINRGYVLDLSDRASLLRWLAAQGFRPFLVDWGAPGAEERRFDLTAYVAARLEPALDAVLAASGRKPAVIGYCMGGLLALALALRRSADTAGLACLATPWDFHAERAGQARLLGAGLPFLEPLLAILGELPVDVIQALFTSVDPFQAARKFTAFADLDPDSDHAASFVALEDWLNDGVPLAAPVARECLAGWYGANTPAEGTWRIEGTPVTPGAYDGKALIVLPGRDRIVPPASAAALAAAMPGAARLEPESGHIGMVVGSGAETRLYRPLAAWLAGLAPARKRRRG